MAAPKITLQFLQKMISETSPEVTVKSFQVTAGSGRGDNYTSMLYRIKVEGTGGWKGSFIYKCLPDSQARREAFKSDALFRNEVAFYTQALPTLFHFQRSKQIDCEFSAVPQCYLAQSDIIVLEDLKERGFVMLDRKVGLDLMHCQATLRELARFHALSLAMKCQDPEKFAEMVAGEVKEVVFIRAHKEWYRDYYNTCARNALKMIEEALSDDTNKQKYVQKFCAFVDERTFFCSMMDLVSHREPLTVLCHGDCWTNNIMFRYAESGGISEVCFIDFQIARYSSPALDLSYLLYLCTSYELRKNNMTQLIDGYCDTLLDTLQQLGCLPSHCQHCPTHNLRDSIAREMRFYGRYALGVSIELIPILTCDSDQAPDVYEFASSAVEKPQPNIAPVSTSNELCYRKLAELIKELVDNGDL